MSNSFALLIINFAQSPAPVPKYWVMLLPIVMNFLQFLMLASLTYFIFVNNARQKVAEREANWYHKIVVDHCIDLMGSFFRNQSDFLCEASVNAEAFRHAGKDQEADDLIRATLGEFKGKLYSMSGDIDGRLGFFELALGRAFVSRTEQLEDDVTKWFDTYKKSQPFDQRDSLPRALTVCQNDLLRLLNSYEFETWGWPLRSRKSKPSLKS
jgi:hypothetical protein